MMKHLKIALLSALLPFAAVTSAQADAISLNFELPGVNVTGIGYGAIENYYNGGADFNGAVGPNYGISFSPSALSLAEYPNPISNTGLEPGGGNALIFLSQNNAFMNVAAGFTGGFSFYYAAPYDPGSVTVWSGLNGTGTLLATLNLGLTPPGPTPNFGSGGWVPEGVSFSGTAESVDWGGTANEITFADVTLGSGTPIISNAVPDNTGAGIYSLAALGLAGAAYVSRKQAKA
jgi:hypothetical protein